MPHGAHDICAESAILLPIPSIRSHNAFYNTYINSESTGGISIRILKIMHKRALMSLMLLTHNPVYDDSFMSKGHPACSHFLNVTFRVRGRRMQIIYCKRIPRYFQYRTAAQYLLTPRRTLQKKVDEQGVAASARRGAAQRIAIMPYG